jgi:DNA-directed RNA polymerase specialized sigma24 family protein
VQTQDRADYVEFVSSRRPGLRRLAYVLCGDWHNADDIIQASLTKVYLRWSSVRASRDVDQYVRAIVVNTFLSERRLGWSRVRLGELPPEVAAPEDASVEDRTVLRQADWLAAVVSSSGYRPDRATTCGCTSTRTALPTTGTRLSGLAERP